MDRPLKVVLAAVVLVTTACGSDGRSPHADGPLETSADRNEVCMLQTDDGLLTFGVEATQNTSKEQLTIDSVNLTDVEGMSVVGTKVLLVPDSSDSTLVGARNGWPPKLGLDEAKIAKALEKAPTASGASIPGGSSDTVSFVVGVETRPGSHAGPLQVKYTDQDGTKFVWNGTTSYRTSATPCDG